MTALVFVDTNVLVYARDASHRPKHRLAAQWMERLWREQRGRTSIQVLNEFYVTVTRKLRPALEAQAAWDEVETLLAWDPQPLDRALLQHARRVESRYRLSWWDSMVVAAAQLQDCEILLTEDLQPGMSFGQLKVCSPFAEAAQDKAGVYTVEPGLAGRHRRPGRPRRQAAAGGRSAPVSAR